MCLGLVPCARLRLLRRNAERQNRLHLVAGRNAKERFHICPGFPALRRRSPALMHPAGRNIHLLRHQKHVAHRKTAVLDPSVSFFCICDHNDGAGRVFQHTGAQTSALGQLVQQIPLLDDDKFHRPGIPAARRKQTRLQNFLQLLRRDRVARIGSDASSVLHNLQQIHFRTLLRNPIPHAPICRPPRTESFRLPPPQRH